MTDHDLESFRIIAVTGMTLLPLGWSCFLFGEILLGLLGLAQVPTAFRLVPAAYRTGYSAGLTDGASLVAAIMAYFAFCFASNVGTLFILLPDIAKRLLEFLW